MTLTSKIKNITIATAIGGISLGFFYGPPALINYLTNSYERLDVENATVQAKASQVRGAFGYVAYELTWQDGQLIEEKIIMSSDGLRKDLYLTLTDRRNKSLSGDNESVDGNVDRIYRSQDHTTLYLTERTRFPAEFEEADALFATERAKFAEFRKKTEQYARPRSAQ